MKNLYLIILLVITTYFSSAQASKARDQVLFAGENDLANANMSQQVETAILAGGCFWGMEDIIRKIPGVISTDVGYSGGVAKHITYNEVKKGNSGHAEAVRVRFDRTKLTYKTLLEYFFRMHDPTTINQQGNDKGTQYRSAIFFTNSEQQAVAKEVIKTTNKSGRWKKPVVTQLVEFSGFVEAEDEHQDYLVKNPQGYTCHWLRK